MLRTITSKNQRSVTPTVGLQPPNYLLECVGGREILSGCVTDLLAPTGVARVFIDPNSRELICLSVMSALQTCQHHGARENFTGMWNSGTFLWTFGYLSQQKLLLNTNTVWISHPLTFVNERFWSLSCNLEVQWNLPERTQLFKESVFSKVVLLERYRIRKTSKTGYWLVTYLFLYTSSKSFKNPNRNSGSDWRTLLPCVNLCSGPSHQETIDYRCVLGVLGCPPTIVKSQPQHLKT